MARTTGPLMSFDASGTLAKTIVFSRWKGRSYVRRWTVPANPKTALQEATRSMMTFLSQQWSSISAPDQATWNLLAESLKISPFNAYVRANQRAFTNFDPPYQATPPAKLGTPGACTVVATVDNRLVTLQNTDAGGTGVWGILFCVAPTAIVGCTRGSVASVRPDSAGSATAILGPLLPGTYGAVTRDFTTDGIWGADGTPITFVVT